MLTNPDLERLLLGAFADTPDLIWEWADRLPAAAFAREDLRALYEAQQAAAATGLRLPRPEGEPVGLANPSGAAEELLSLYQRRRLTGLCQTVLQRVRDARDAGDLLAALMGDLADLEAERGQIWAAGLTPVRDLLPALWADLDAREQATEGTGLPGIPTGFKHLDNLTNGLEPGLYLLGGPPKSGKTTFTNTIAYNVAAAGLPVVYVSFENDPLDLLLKQLCRLSGQPLLPFSTRSTSSFWRSGRPFPRPRPGGTMKEPVVVFAQPFSVNAGFAGQLAGRVAVLDLAFCADTDRST